MKPELLQPTATIVAALVSTQNGHNINESPHGLQELFVSVYRALEKAQAQLLDQPPKESQSRVPKVQPLRI